MKKLELLAPAGNLLKMKTAFTYGADAVYLGLPDFSLRVRINDFNLAGIKMAVKYAQAAKKKVYVTINIFAHNRHFKKLPAYLKQLRALKVDALIVSDPGVIAVVKKYWPAAEIHLSTQANCTNSEAVKFWARRGIKRIILGREVTLKEIKEIHRAAPAVELEYFVHGAMCMAYSGRCFLSKLFVDRSANLGDCAQPCRWKYDVNRYEIKAGGHEEILELVEEKHGAYLLNSRDLCLLKYLRELRAAGVTSFKIEGRAKSVYYQATITGIYRRALNLLAAPISAARWQKETNLLYKELTDKVTHRGYTSGFLSGGRADQNIVNSHQASAWEFCGQVIKSGAAKAGVRRIYFTVHNTVKVGDSVEIIKPEYDIIKTKPRQLWDAKTGAKLLEAHGGGGRRQAILEIPAAAGAVPIGTVLRRKIN
ncbi:TPA: peptidase U32 [Candidatus Falkowbacteria bacterium]|nr:MAG: Peptidase U32 [Candidatus Falkowbacteria bacterium GW2011_GWF2_43_32]HBA36743.1 peptidase U32 [Candidatus Falkowbacteria bacterium]